METLKKTHKEASEFVDSIFSESTVQGLKFVGCRNLKNIERIFWTVAVTACLISSGYLIYGIYEKYKSVSLIVSLQPEETSINRIAFPAITICNVNIFKTSVLNELLTDLAQAQNNTENPDSESLQTQLQGALEHLTQFCLATPSFRRETRDILCDINGGPDIMDEWQKVLLSLNASDESYLTEMYKKHRKETVFRTIFTYYRGGVNCKDMILKCAWSGKEILCNETFVTLDTRQGRCCVFNMMPKFLLQNISRDSMQAKLEGRRLPADIIKEWEKFTMDDLVTKKGRSSTSSFPKHQIAGGSQYGLSILINPQIEDYSTCTTDDGWGFMMHAHSPLSMPSIREFGSAIPVNSEVYVEIEPYVTDADSKVMRDIKIESRECYISTDKQSQLSHYNFYTIENCFAECLAHFQAIHCSCIQQHLPNNGSIMPCRAKQRDCADTVLENVAIASGDEDPCAHCRSPCTDIEYKMAVHHFDLQDEALKFPPLYNDSQGFLKSANNYSIVHIHFGTDSLLITERKSLYNIFRLMGDAGSLLGFTLGISIVSFVEFLYYFTLRFYFHLRSVQGERRNRVHSISSHATNNKAAFKFDPYGVLKVHVKPVTQKDSNSPAVYPFLR